MKIECKLKREGGSIIDIEGVAYEFKPQADGAHVADVGNDAHAERFLSIPEAYGIYRAGKAVKEAPAPAPGVDNTPLEEGLPTEVVEPVTDAGDDLNALKAEYKERFGKAAHHTWSAETIKDKLAAE